MSKSVTDIVVEQVPTSLLVREETHAASWLEEIAGFVESEAYAS